MGATLAGFHAVVLLYLVGCGQGGVVSAVDEGTRYLDLKEAYVTSIASSAHKNQANCGNLDGCKSACTRAECHPVGGTKTTQCAQVDNNEFCGTNGENTCKYMVLDYTQSFTCLPGDVTKLLPEVARDICFHKGLEPTYKNVSKPSEYSFVFYASVSGARTSYPGRESECSTPYDPRKRPWYLDGISVKKEVKILIDVGSTMATPVSPDYGRPPEYTYMNLAQDTALELLQSFSSQDYVEVVSFDSVRQTSLEAPVNIMPYESLIPSVRPELAPLVQKVRNLVSSPEVTPSNLDAAIAKASSSFVSATTGTYLKVVMVLTNGLFAPLNSTTTGFPLKAVEALRAKLMVYKFPSNQQDRFLLTTTLKENLCAVNGSFELLVPQETFNPLYAMRSYFTYVARVHLAVADRPNWSNKYLSHSQLHNMSTVTYPVFGSDSLLIGVAGIDVAIEDLPANLRTLVLNDLPNRSQGILSAPATFSMTCDYQTADRDEICPNSTASPISEAVCNRSDFTSTLQQRTCCGSGEGGGTCAVPEGPPGRGGFAPWKIGVIAGVAAVVATIIATFVVRTIWFSNPPEDVIPPYRGPPEEPNGQRPDDFRDS